MTHRRAAHGWGRQVHQDNALRHRRRFTLTVLMMVAVGAFPPALLFAGPIWVHWILDERRRAIAARPTRRDAVITRGRRNV